MVLRLIMRYFMNERMISRLADSRPIREAAKMVVSIMYRTNEWKYRYKITENPKEVGERFKEFGTRFTGNLKKEIEKVKEEMKKKR